MESLATRLIDQFTSEMVGIPVALVLLGVTYLVLPPSDRQRARQSAVLLGLSVLVGATRFVLPRDAAAHRAMLFSATFFLLASMGRSAVLLVVYLLFDRKRERPSPRIFRDLSTGITYLFVGLVALRAIGVEPGSILTTSALLTAVVGLSLQDTLGNLVSGLALQMQRPFDVGDWIEIDNGAQAGQVTEVTWRATSIMTLDRVEVILPNAGLAKAAIRNYSRPSKVSRRRLNVGVAYGTAPSEVHQVLVSAAAGCPGVLETPPPRARTKAFADSAVTHELLYFVDDFARALDIDGEVLDRVYHGLARRGFDIPFPTRVLVTSPVDDGTRRLEVDRVRVAAAMGAVDLLKPLPDDSRQLLVDRAGLRRYGPGEPVVRKGDPSQEMFIVERGALAVEVPRDGSPAAEVATLGAGECFGEMGLLTGELRSATVRAKTLCDLIVIDHESFHDVLAAHPEIVERMGGLLASRQAGLEAVAATDRAPATAERQQRLISKIRDFFKLV